MSWRIYKSLDEDWLGSVLYDSKGISLSGWGSVVVQLPTYFYNLRHLVDCL